MGKLLLLISWLGLFALTCNKKSNPESTKEEIHQVEHGSQNQSQLDSLKKAKNDAKRKAAESKE